jgi:hypothetical protein
VTSNPSFQPLSFDKVIKKYFVTPPGGVDYYDRVVQVNSTFCSISDYSVVIGTFFSDLQELSKKNN